MAAAATLGISTWAMAGRIVEYHRVTDHTVPMFHRASQREFEFFGRHVSIADEKDRVVIRYGDRTLELRPTLPPLSPQLPGLARHDSWLAVLWLVEHPRATGAKTTEALERGEIEGRLVVVARDPHLELEATAHGRGRPSDWTFDLHELTPEGEIRTERYGFPLSRRAARAVAAGEQATGAVPPLREGTWQYYAALMTIPRGSKPTPAFTQDAVRATGWTLPSAAFSGLVLTLAVPWFLAPRRRRG